MGAEEQKALADFVTQMVNKGETIENVIKNFYGEVQFADSEEQAKEILEKDNTDYTTVSNKVLEIRVNDKIVTIISYSLISQGYVYVLSIDELKAQNLSDYYKALKNQPTPQKEFREKIAKECGVTEMTIFRWLSGETIPEKLKREKIAEITGLPVNNLFPNLPPE